jgi:hypothetical protein
MEAIKWKEKRRRHRREGVEREASKANTVERNQMKEKPKGKIEDKAKG